MTESRGLVLIVEDERHISDVQRLYLTREGFGVHVEADGSAGLAAARRMHPVAIVLDIGLPGMDGIAFCRALRDAGDWTPVLLVTARGEEADRILGLELGADDYLTKPFSPRELVARVKTVLRRVAGPPGPPPTGSAGRLSVDPVSRTVRRDGEPVELTATEFNLLSHSCGTRARSSPASNCSPRYGGTPATGTPVWSTSSSRRYAPSSATRARSVRSAASGTARRLPAREPRRPWLPRTQDRGADHRGGGARGGPHRTDRLADRRTRGRTARA